jgi:WD40 repeat protein
MESLQDDDPRHIAAYRLIKRLAVGGMGIVYLGESPGGRKVAVKLIRPERAADPEFLARFRQEVAAARSVSGFHTAAFIDADPHAARPWMATQYVPGPSLDALVKRSGPLEPAAAHQLAAALAEGLDAIHSAGLVHRDLKPLNIIVAPDGPRIIDFGIAKPAGATSDPRLTATGMVVGTPAFLSPEQFDGDGLVGPASDVFSLGSVLAFAATGRVPFQGGDFTATSYAIVNKPPDLRLPAGPLFDVITACLVKDPARRPTAAWLVGYLHKTRPASRLSPPERDSAVACEPIVAIVPAVQDQPTPLAQRPAPAVLATAAPAPARPASVRAVIRRGALARRSQAPGARAGGTRPPLLLPSVPTPAVQVRPARQGWRLVTADPAGHWIAAANGDGIITTWLAESGQPVRSWSPGGRVRAMTAGPDDLLVVAMDDGSVRAWDAATGIACRYLPDTVPGLTGRENRIRVLSLDPSGSWLAAGVDGRLLLWDVAAPSEPVLAAKLPVHAEVTALAFDDKGGRLATGRVDGKVHVWDLAELAEAAPAKAGPAADAFDPVPLEPAWVDLPGTLPGASRPHRDRVLALALDQQNDRWVSVGKAGPDGWSDGGATEGSPIAGGPLRAAALCPEAGFAAVIDEERGRVHIADLVDPGHPRVLDGTDLSVTGVAFTGSGTLAVGGSDGSLRLWHPSSRSMRMVRTAGSSVTAVAASPTGARLVISDKRGELSSFDAVNGSLKQGWTVSAAQAGNCLAFQADGTRLATAGDAVRIWDAADGTPLATLPGRTGGARAVATDADGKRIAAAWAETVVTVWEGKKLLWELTGHSGAVLTVAFGPRPGLLVSAGDDHTIRTWDLATGKQAACHAADGYRVTVLAASRRGDALAAGCADGTILLPEIGQPGTLPDWAGATVLTGHVHGITAMSFDGSGKLLATASRDGTARIWDLAARSATTVLLPESAAVVCPDGTWRGLGETDGLIWRAVGLTRVPLPTLEAMT